MGVIPHKVEENYSLITHTYIEDMQAQYTYKFCKIHKIINV